MKLSLLTSVICLAATPVVAMATVRLNYDPSLTPPAPTLDGGWAYDVAPTLATNSIDSPYVFSLTTPAYFRMTDAFIVGDVYTVLDFGNPFLVTNYGTPAVRSAFGDDPTADAAWVSGNYTTGEVLLAPGNYSLTVQDTSSVEFPAGFYTRLDSVPEPATLALLGLGVAGLLSRRRKA